MQKNDNKTVDLLIRALESAPMPMEWKMSSIHPEDIQKWTDRYIFWYKEIRHNLLISLGETPKNSIYFQLDRLIQEAKYIHEQTLSNVSIVRGKEEPVASSTEEATGKPAQKGIVIGAIKTKKSI